MDRQIQNLRNALRTKRKVPTRRWGERVAARCAELERSRITNFGSASAMVHGLAVMARKYRWTPRQVEQYLDTRVQQAA